MVAPLVAQVMRRGPKGDARRFLEAIAWILRSGAPWRDLAKDFGPWEPRGLVRHRSKAVLADRAYDSNAFLAHVETLGAKAVIPSRRNRREPRELDGALYAQRNVIERWFGRLKVFRRVATRYEKTALSYLGVVAASAWLVAITGWTG